MFGDAKGGCRFPVSHADTCVKNNGRGATATALHFFGKAAQRAELLLDLRMNDIGAASSSGFNQPAPFQDFQCLSGRHPACAEIFGHLPFGGKSFTSLENAGSYLRGKRVRDPLVERRVVGDDCGH